MNMPQHEADELLARFQSHGRMLVAFGGEYVLKAFGGAVKLTEGHLGEAWTLCFIAMRSAETEERPRVYALEAAVPEEVLRPVRIAELARATGIPYETAKRYVLSLVSKGACVRRRSGYVPSEAYMQSGPVVANMIYTVAQLHVMVRQLEEGGMLDFIRTPGLDELLLSLIPDQSPAGPA